MKAAFGTIGSGVEAYFLAACLPVGDEEALYDAGWAFIGSGTTRDCWLNPSGTVVYKYGSPSCNMDEHEAATKVRDFLRGCSPRTVKASKVIYFPKTRYFEQTSILAMEYIEGDELEGESDLEYDARDALEELGLAGDFWYRNGIEMADGRVGLIDLGYELASAKYL